LVAVLWPRERLTDRHQERGKFIERGSVESRTKLKTEKPSMSNHISPVVCCMRLQSICEFVEKSYSQLGRTGSPL